MAKQLRPKVEDHSFAGVHAQKRVGHGLQLTEQGNEEHQDHRGAEHAGLCPEDRRGQNCLQKTGQRPVTHGAVDGDLQRERREQTEGAR